MYSKFCMQMANSFPVISQENYVRRKDEEDHIHAVHNLKNKTIAIFHPYMNEKKMLDAEKSWIFLFNVKYLK